jgi:hypothetical protein
MIRLLPRLSLYPTLASAVGPTKGASTALPNAAVAAAPGRATVALGAVLPKQTGQGVYPDASAASMDFPTA